MLKFQGSNLFETMRKTCGRFNPVIQSAIALLFQVSNEYIFPNLEPAIRSSFRPVVIG